MLLLDRSTLAAFREVSSWIFGRRRRIRVDGGSMLPTLEPGDQVLMDSTAEPSVGQIVVADHPDGQALLVIKRVAAIEQEGVVLHSDNPSAGTDSRTWGPVDRDLVVGTVTLVFGKPNALGQDPPHRRPPAVR